MALLQSPLSVETFASEHFIKLNYRRFCPYSRTHSMEQNSWHHGDVIMGTMASQIPRFTTVYSSVYSGADQGKHQSSALLAFVRVIHRLPVNSPHKGPATRKMFPFDDVIMKTAVYSVREYWRKWTETQNHRGKTIAFLPCRRIYHITIDGAGRQEIEMASQVQQWQLLVNTGRILLLFLSKQI